MENVERNAWSSRFACGAGGGVIVSDEDVQESVVEAIAVVVVVDGDVVVVVGSGVGVGVVVVVVVVAIAVVVIGVVVAAAVVGSAAVAVAVTPVRFSVEKVVADAPVGVAEVTPWSDAAAPSPPEAAQNSDEAVCKACC